MANTAIAVPLFGLGILIVLSPVLWLGDMLTFFLPWVFGATLASFLFALALRLRVAAISAGILAIIALVPMLDAWSRAPLSSGPSSQLRVTTFNTLGGTADPELLTQFLEAERPDILVLEEYSSRLDARLELSSMFAFRSDSDQARVPSLVLLSRHPIVSVEIVPPVGSIRGQGVMRIVIDWNGTEIVAYAVHATTPRHGPGDWRERNEILSALSASVANEPAGTPVVVAGDFNTPPWSPFFRRLTRSASLSDTSGAFLPAATRIVERGWLPELFGSPVDHILVSEGFGWRPIRIGPDLGSDHRPVTADLTIPLD